MTARYKFAILSGKRAVVDIEYHRQGRFVDIDFRQCFRIFRVSNGFPDFKIWDADDAGNISHRRFVCFDPFQSFISIYAANFCLTLAFTIGNDDLLVWAHTATDNTADGDFTYIVIIVQGRNHELERAINIAFRARAIFNNAFKERFQVIAVIVHRIFSNPVAAIRIDDREIQLVIVSFQFHEQFQYFIFYFGNAGIGFINFIDDDNRLQFLFQSLAQYIFRLRHRAFKSIYQKQNAINHVEDTFYFATEISMPRSIDYVDFYAIVHDRSIFG